MAFDRSQFTAALVQWFQQAQRSLPWRESENMHDPYRVLVSEIMLQQTTVAAVIPYYHRFLERFPTLSSLAAADVDEVLPLWAGLGYYSRARNLHACAQAVVERHGSTFPTAYEQVLALPGIGRYTAGAVLSIALGQQIPIVDANVARLLSRLLCIQEDIKSTGAQKRLWNEATELVERTQQPSQFNPAMMELGALICSPRKPDCAACPVSSFCCAYATGRQEDLPVIAPKRAEVELHDICAFVTVNDRVLLRQRTEECENKNWWLGMWELPRTTRQDGETSQQALKRLLARESFDKIDVQKKLKTVKHGVTHHKITLDCYHVELENTGLPEQWDFFEWDETTALALPSAMKRLLRWLQHEHLANEQLELL